MIITDVTSKRNLPSDIVKVDAIRMRIYRGSEFIPEHHERGLSSPLLQIEPTIVEILLQMVGIRKSLTVSQAVELVNDVIKNYAQQQNLIDSKTKYYSTSLPAISSGYWRGFIKKNKGKIVNVVGKIRIVS